ncbi:type II toxin-antitoxin system HipA family toxin [Candidatus Acetatifactor stercoripullorum]|uniref:type II toxin-antitoxin system HipA family toxin n=1 Tax=Candidatus Acetatifactor stercoripullorum TaxID=2838414 RepID=UPI00298DBCDA|nr:HipA domain-containing protein [Candidatus Acetatifactor stercoripullorum]
MNCLCCGKPLRTEDTHSGWHKSCIRRFFGTIELPEIVIDEVTFEALATESTNKGYTVPGVQKKLSLHLFSEGNTPRLTLVNYPTGYILKPQVSEFEALPQAEHLVMCMADAAGISTVPHALIMGKDSPAYITKRVDRIFMKNKMQMLAMEDFCQLDLRLTQDKYKGSYERCAKIIERYSSRKGLDITELYLRLVFSFLVGNSDMHLKNFSLLETEEGSGKYVLSPAYDLLPVNVIMAEDKEQFALAMNGKKTHIRRKDFLVFAEECAMTRSSAEKMIAMLVSKKEKLLAVCQNSLLPEHLKERLASLIEERAGILEG